MDAFFLQERKLNALSSDYAAPRKGFLLLGNLKTIGACSDLFSHFVKNDKNLFPQACAWEVMHVATERKERIICPPKRKP